MTPFRKASLIDYLLWFNLAQMNGVQPTHFYDYPFKRNGMVVAQRNFTMDGECGAAALSIIVPEPIVATGGFGHNQLYYLDPVIVDAGHFTVPVYSDKEFTNFPGIREFIREEKIKQAQFEHKTFTRQTSSDISRWKRGKC